MASRHGRKGRRAATGGDATVVSGNDVSQLLPAAVHHHEQGNLNRARVLYEQILSLDPRHADALQYFGILCHQEGDPARAEALIQQAIEIKPSVAPYHDNLGTVLEAAGRLEDALATYQRADGLEPGDPDREFNMGVVLERLARPAEAEVHYRAALEHRPGDADSLFGLANALKSQGRREDAEETYRRLLAEHPSHPGARVNLANLLRDRGLVRESAELALEAVRRAPGDAGAHHCLGCAYVELERSGEAQECFEEALRLAPAMREARLALAHVLERQGRLDRAYAAYRALASDGTLPEAAAGLLRVARIRDARGADPVLEAILESELRAGRLRAGDFARVLGRAVAARAGLDDVAAGGDGREALARALELVRDPLLRGLLERCVNVVPEVERWLTTVRRELLLGGRREHDDGHAGDIIGLLGALALQCTRNEHVFAVSDDEATELASLRAELERPLALGEAQRLPAVEADLLCLACYMPLSELANAQALVQVAPQRWSAPMTAVLEQSLGTRLRERGIAESIASIGEVVDAVSCRVRAQYEENPYPRWSELTVEAWDPGHPRGPLEQYLARRAAELDEPPRILVAGCGTGQEAVALAARYPEALVTALDLSRASLAYGARMARESGVPGVSFIQGDLLDAPSLQGVPFDVVSSVGVLHHMEAPERGLRALVSCLSDHGMIRIGLYSARARQVVNRARQRIGDLGLAPDARGVRTLRARILGGEEPELLSLLDSEDFYTLSACRDLLFHTKEHQYSLDEVAELLEAAGLDFVAFQLPHLLMQRRFDDVGLGSRDDLGAWARFEEQAPDAFEGMYVMWCTRRSAAASVQA